MVAVSLKKTSWADAINKAGQEQPQRLVPGLFETEIVRRRRAMTVHGVQYESRVHRPIADVSRSTSYVAAPVLSGDRVVGLLHADRYLSGRDTDAADCEAITAYARCLQMAFTRAAAVERLDAVSSAMRLAANDCDETVSAANEFSLDAALLPGEVVIPAAPRVTRRAVRSVRDLLTGREAEILEEMGDAKKAEASLVAARKSYPKSDVALRALVQFYQRTGQGPSASVMLDRAVADARRAPPKGGRRGRRRVAAPPAGLRRRLPPPARRRRLPPLRSRAAAAGAVVRRAGHCADEQEA